MKRLSAFTLLELLIALAILSILTMAAVPSLSAQIARVRMTSAVNNLVHSLNSARQNARLTGIPTTVCPSNDGQHCAPDPDWNHGWLVFTNADNDFPPQIDAGERILLAQGSADNLRISANRRAFTMRPIGQRSTNGTFIWCAPGTPHTRKAVTISYTGKPRVRAAATAHDQTPCGEES